MQKHVGRNVQEELVKEEKRKELAYPYD